MPTKNSETSTFSAYGRIIDRETLATVATPQGTDTHRPVPHIEVVNALVETLNFRHIGVVDEQYTVSKDGAKMFGCLDLETEADRDFHGCRFAIGLRNAHDKSMRLAMTCGYRVFVCENMAFSGDFHPLLAKHSKNFNLLNSVSVGIDQMQRNFKPLIEQVEFWKGYKLSDPAAKCLIYEAFVEAELDIHHSLMRKVHELYFKPQYDEFSGRDVWSLNNAFTSAAKELDPLAQFRETAAIGEFFDRRFKK